MENNFYQRISENKTYCLFAKKLKIPITERNKKAFKEKDVDFFFNFEKIPIYVEVKSNLNEKTFKSGNIGEKNKIFYNRFLKRLNDKLLDNSYNIAVINDSNTSRISIFDSLKLLPHTEGETLEELNKYQKISALIVLSPNYQKRDLGYQTFYNPSCQKQLPQKLKDILDLYKSNKDSL